MVAWLSVSGDLLGTECEEVVRVMQQLNIVGDVTPNRSIGPDGSVEVGCRVLVLGGEDKLRMLWEVMRVKARLGCAHVSIGENRSGCVFDVFAETRCPSKVFTT